MEKHCMEFILNYRLCNSRHGDSKTSFSSVMSTKKNPLPLKSKYDQDDNISVSTFSSSTSSGESFSLGELDLFSDEDLGSRSASTCCECSCCDDSDISTCCSCRCCKIPSLISASSLFSSLDSFLSSTSEDQDQDLSECSVASSGEDCRRNKNRINKKI